MLILIHDCYISRVCFTNKGYRKSNFVSRREKYNKTKHTHMKTLTSKFPHFFLSSLFYFIAYFQCVPTKYTKISHPKKIYKVIRHFYREFVFSSPIYSVGKFSFHNFGCDLFSYFFF